MKALCILISIKGTKISSAAIPCLTITGTVLSSDHIYVSDGQRFNLNRNLCKMLVYVTIFVV